MYGLTRATVNDQLKIQKLEVFFDPESFIKTMEGRLKPSDLKGGKAIIGDIECPFIEKSSKLKAKK